MTAMTEARSAATTGRTAVVYRMATPQHLRPSELMVRDLLRRRGFESADHLIISQQEQDAFTAKYDVTTTPGLGSPAKASVAAMPCAFTPPFPTRTR